MHQDNLCTWSWSPGIDTTVLSATRREVWNAVPDKGESLGHGAQLQPKGERGGKGVGQISLSQYHPPRGLRTGLPFQVPGNVYSVTCPRHGCTTCMAPTQYTLPSFFSGPTGAHPCNMLPV